MAIVFVSGVVMAETFTDDFNRENTPQSASTATVGGTGWVQDGDGTGTASDWFINANALAGRNRGADLAILYNNSSKTVSGNGSSFTLSTDVSAKVASVWAGVIFNYQNAGNYYVFRFKGGSTSYQLIKVADGKNAQVIVAKNDSRQVFAVDSFYTIKVTSDAAGSFEFTITAAGKSEALNPVITGMDTTGSSFENGYAGMYLIMAAKGHNAKFDNFSLKVVSQAVLGSFHRQVSRNVF